MIDTTRSNSEEQRSIENYVIREIERILGFPLERNVSVQLADNIYINPDFYSNDQTIVRLQRSSCRLRTRLRKDRSS